MVGDEAEGITRHCERTGDRREPHPVGWSNISDSARRLFKASVRDRPWRSNLHSRLFDYESLLPSSPTPESDQTQLKAA